MTRQSTQLARNEATDIAESADSQLRVAPPVDIYEDQNEIRVVADVPGVSPDAANVRLDGQELVIDASQPESDDGAYEPIRFYRAFRVPNTIDPDGVKAEHRHGVLTVRLAKSEAAKPRRIKVRAA